MEIHEVASIFPLMSDDEFRGLKDDIEANGQREPVWTHDGKVIDGRNRLRACEELGITPKLQEWDGKGSLVGFVVSLNLHRRHLSSGQRAACGTDIEERLAVEAKDRQRIAGREHGGDKRSQEVRAVRVERVVERIPQADPAPKARDEAARLVGTNPRYIQDAKAVKAAAPELHEKVKAGTITLPQAKREVQRAEKRTVLEEKAKAAPEAADDWRIITGDCVETLATLDAGCARLIFADPPYNIGVEYGDHHDDSQADGDFLDWSREWIKLASQLLTPDGSLWVLINDEYADHFGLMLRDVGLHRRAWIKWYESFGVNCSNNFNRTSRHLFYMVKDPKRFVFNADAVNRPSDRQVKYGDRRADSGGKVWDDVWGVNPPIPRLVGTAEERLPDFPTQLPMALLRAVVGCASDPGDLVIDPFNGSGTTGAACIETGRRYIGIEKSERFSELATMRLKAAQREGQDDAA